MTNTCEDCIHWRPIYVVYGECSKVRDKMDFNVEAGWEGGYVASIETYADFGCVLFSAKEESE